MCRPAFGERGSKTRGGVGKGEGERAVDHMPVVVGRNQEPDSS